MAKALTSLDRALARLDDEAWERKEAKARAADAKRKAEAKTAAEIAAEDLEDAAAMSAWEIVRKSRRHSIAAYAFEHGTWPEHWSKEKINAEVEQLADAVELEAQRQKARLADDPDEVQRILGKAKEKKEGGKEYV